MALLKSCPLRVSVPRKTHKGTNQAPPPPQPVRLKASTRGDMQESGKRHSKGVFHSPRSRQHGPPGPGSEPNAHVQSGLYLILPFTFSSSLLCVGPGSVSALPKVNQKELCPQGVSSPTGKMDE